MVAGNGWNPWATASLDSNKENVGFGRANNQAFAELQAPLLFLLNSDAEFHEGALDQMIATIRENEKIGVVGPRLNESGRQPATQRLAQPAHTLRNDCNSVATIQTDATTNAWRVAVGISLGPFAPPPCINAKRRGNYCETRR